MSTLSERIISWFTNRHWRALVAAAAVLTTVSDAAAQVTITWDPSPEPDVAGYKLYVGAESRIYHEIIDVGNRTTHTVTGLQDDRPYYFAVTAYTSTGGESAHSTEVTNAVAMRLLPDDTSLNIDRVNYSRHPALMTYTWPERTPANAALLMFDLSGIPPGALVHRATLRLFLIDSDTFADTNYAVTAHKIVGAVESQRVLLPRHSARAGEHRAARIQQRRGLPARRESMDDHRHGAGLAGRSGGERRPPAQRRRLRLRRSVSQFREHGAS
jgi:hypothetical protein